jgi:hypothetical protein
VSPLPLLFGLFKPTTTTFSVLFFIAICDIITPEMPGAMIVASFFSDFIVAKIKVVR